MYLARWMWSSTMQDMAIFRPSKTRLYRNSEHRSKQTSLERLLSRRQLLGIFAKRKQASSFSFHRWEEGLALRDVGLIRRRSGVSKASPRCFRAKWHRSASRSPSLNLVAFAQTSRAVPPNLAKVILNTIQRLELPQDFSGTTTASSLVTPKKAAQAIVQLTQERNPPLRLLLGSDAYAAAEKNDLARLEEARIWKKLSVSTDFETK